MIQLYECPQLAEGLICGGFSRTRERERVRERERERKERHRQHIPSNNVIRRRISAHTTLNFNKEFKDDIGCLGIDGSEQIQDIVKTSMR